MKSVRKLNTNLYPEKIIEELKKLKSHKHYKTSNLPKFIFLCGKGFKNEEDETQSNRNKVIEFFKKLNRKDICFVYAEKLWNMNIKKGIDLLTYENYLADFSDGIILFVESYGSACELGAFSMRKEIISKMLVVIDKKYKNDNSFIQDGPVKKIKKVNSNNIIYTDLLAIFSNPEIHNKLESLVASKACKINSDQNNIDLRSFILEFFELINLAGPISITDLICIYKYIKDFTEFDKRIHVKQVVDSLKKLDLIEVKDGMLISKKQDFNQPFMFDMTKFQYNTIRAKLLARKYKYGKGNIA